MGGRGREERRGESGRKGGRRGGREEGIEKGRKRGEERRGERGRKGGKGGEERGRKPGRKRQLETTCMDATHSCVVSNKLSVSNNWKTEGSKGVVYRGLTKPPSRI